MEENSQKNVVNHFEAGSNCQVFNGNITGCTFAMPGSTVTQQAAAETKVGEIDAVTKQAAAEDKVGEIDAVTKQAAAEAKVGEIDAMTKQAATAYIEPADRNEELCHFIHPAVDYQQEWQIHDEVKRLAMRQGIKEICQHLLQMSKDKKLLLPQSPLAAYVEMVRMGMSQGAGFNEKTFQKYYRRA